MGILNLNRLKWLLPALCLLSIGWMYTSLWTLHHTIEEFNSPMVFNVQFNVAVCSFLLSTFLCFKLFIGLSRKNSNISVLLWDVFYSATVAILTCLLVKSMLLYFITSTVWALKVWNLFEFVIYTFFIAHCFFSIKKLILYQKTNRTIILWVIFELSVFASILTSFFLFKYNSLVFTLFTLPLTILGSYLSFNVKWAAFLNFHQKLVALMLLIISFGILSGLFLDIYEQHIISSLAVDAVNNAFLMAISAFVLLNISISILVLLFSLPTSSVFEQKFGEVMLFQKLHQSIQLGETEIEIHKALLESCCDSAMATGGWLEMTDSNGRITSFENNGIDHIDAFNFKNLLRKNHIKITSEPQYIKDVRSLSHLQKINTNRYKSLLLLPLLSGQHRLGTLVLLKDKVNAFDKEMVDMIITFMSQAAIAIQNSRLMGQALETERYREELKIAKQVQERLLPDVPHYSSDIEIAVLTGGATDVGGDYYDFYKDKAGDITVVLGDVSGHGTSAAFNMAQTKGIFQSLVQLNLDPIDFLRYANTALARCFEKSTFLTLLVIKINPTAKTLQIARAGHCLPLFYSNKQTEYIESKGTGLGVVRGKDYASFIECKVLPYHAGDSLLLYTDGIVEASNKQGELFGTDRLKSVFINYKEMKANRLLEKIFQETKAFSGKSEPEDDSTLLLLKFV
jgi:sigma-B regulation protein RsbU (phosphoserine phosphatase)